MSFLQRSVPLPKRVADLTSKFQTLQERSYPSDSALASAAVPVLNTAFELVNVIQNQHGSAESLDEVMGIIRNTLDFVQAETDVDQEFPLDMDQAGLAKLSINRVLGQNVSLLRQLRRGFMRSVTGQSSLNSFVNRVTTEELQKRLQQGPEAFMRPPFVPPYASGVARFDSTMAGVGVRIPLSTIGVNPGASLVTGSAGRAVYEARCSVTSVQDIRPVGLVVSGDYTVTVGAKQALDDTWRLPAVTIHSFNAVKQSLYTDNLETPAAAEEACMLKEENEITGLFPQVPRCVVRCPENGLIYIATDNRIIEFSVEVREFSPQLICHRVFRTPGPAISVSVTDCGRRLYATAGQTLYFWDLDKISADSKGETLSTQDLESRLPRGLQARWIDSCINGAGIDATGKWDCRADLSVVAALADDRVAVAVPAWRAIALLTPVCSSDKSDSEKNVAADAPESPESCTKECEDLPQEYTVHYLVGHTSIPTVIAQSPQRADYFTTGAADGVIRCWSASQAAPILAFKAHAGAVTSIVYPNIADNFLVFTAGRDEGIKMFDLRKAVRRCVYELSTGNNNAVAMAWDYETATLITATDRIFGKLPQLAGVRDEFEALRLLQGETETEASDVEITRARRGAVKRDSENTQENVARVPWPDQAFHQPTQFQIPWDARGDRLNAYRFALRPAGDTIEVPQELQDAYDKFKEMRRSQQE